MVLRKETIVTLILIFIFIFSIFIDLYNGYVQLHKNSETFVQYIYKGIILLIGIFSIRPTTKYGLFAILLLLLSLVTVLYWQAFGNIFSYKYEITRLLQLLYPFLIFAFLLLNADFIKKDTLLKYIVIYGVIAASSLFITEMMGIAYYKYGENHSFGIKGLFVAGNDLGLTLLICNALACYFFIKTSSIYYALANLIMTSAGIIIGSVTGIFGSVMIMGLLAFNIFFNNTIFFKKLKQSKQTNKIKKWPKYYMFILILIGTPVLYVIIDFIVTIDEYNIGKFDLTRLTTGGARDYLRDAVQTAISTRKFGTFIFGSGISDLHLKVGRVLMYGENVRAIEIDHYELIGGYGLLLGGIIFIVPFFILFKYIKTYFKTKSVFYFWGTVAVSMFIGHGVMAGHAYLNVMANQIIAVFAFCILKDKRKKLNLK